MDRISRNNAWVVDIVFAVSTYGFFLAVDPFSATTICLPLVGLGFWVRRRLWPTRPVSGGLVLFFNIPICTLGVACLFTLGSFGLFLGTILAVFLLGTVQWIHRLLGRDFVGRFVLVPGVIFFAASFVFAGILMETGIANYPTEEFVKVVSRAPSPPRWTAESKGEAVRVVYDVLDRGVGDVRFGTPGLKGEPSPYGVFVTLYDSHGYSSRGVAANDGDSREKLIVATLNAIEKRPKRARKKTSRKGPWTASPQDTRVQIDVAGAPRGATIRPFFYLFSEWIRKADSSLEKLSPLGDLLNLAFQIESGVDGLILSKDDTDETAVMLPSDPVTLGWFTPRVRSAPKKVRQMIRRTWKRQFGELPDSLEDNVSVKRMRTQCFGATGLGGEVVDWYRGNKLAEEKLLRKDLLAGTILTTDWLTRQVKGDGEFHYQVYPPYRKETRSYNLPRHAGSVYGLFAFYRASTRATEFREAGERALRAGIRALGYIGDNLGVPPSGQTGHLCFLDKKKRTHSGSTALAALALAELPNPNGVADRALRGEIEAVARDEWLIGIGDCLRQMIDEGGAVFKTYEQSREQDHVVDEPLYYPGEVMLALTRIYRINREERFLEGARRIGERQLRIFKWPLLLDFPWPGDHWIIQALCEIAKITGERKFAELSVLMGRGYLREQHPPQAFLYPDYFGGYRRIADLPRTTRAASRGEALGGAVDAARFLGDDPGKFEVGLIRGARHLLEQQFKEENAYFIPEGFDVVGGIRMGLVDNHLRIDNNQHALVALLRALEAMDHRDSK